MKYFIELNTDVNDEILKEIKETAEIENVMVFLRTIRAKVDESNVVKVSNLPFVKVLNKI